MKNSLIDNNGVQIPQSKNQKTKLESQIEQLKAQEQQINQRLKLWQSKHKKANNLANCLETADKLASKFLAELVENEKSKEQPEFNWLEHLLKNKVEFALKFAAGKEVFTKLILERIERELRILQVEMDSLQSELSHQERKFVRLQARRQGKTLLECKLNNGIGCLGAYWCDNCRTNYPTTNQVQAELKGGAC